MANKLRQHDPTGINRSRVGQALSQARKRFMRFGRSDLIDLRRKVLDLFRDFFRGLGKKRFTFKATRGRGLPIVETFNEDTEAIHSDLATLYEETDRLRRLGQVTFNYNAILSEDLATRAAAAASKVLDLRLLSGQLQEHLIVAGDDFNDLERIDVGFSTSSPKVEVVVSQGVVTLKRTGATQVITEESEVEINPLTAGVTRDPTSENLKRFYEGRFHDYVGRAKPEGGMFNLEERVTDEDQVEGYTKTDYELYYGEEFLGSASDFGGVPTEDRAGLSLLPDNIEIVDRGATPEQLAASRRAIVDGNPDTTWEAEYAFRYQGPLVQWAQARDDLRVEAGLDPTIITNEGAEKHARKMLELDMTQAQRSFWEAALAAAVAAQVAPDELDLEVEVILRTPGTEARDTNFVTLDPVNFGEGAWLEVTEISTAPSEDAPWEPLEGFFEGVYENTLTDEVNEELNEETYKATLAPSKYSYTGQGVWSFPSRKVFKVRFKILQRRFIPNAYQILVAHMRRTITSTVQSRTTVASRTRLIKMNYLQTLQALDDTNVLGSLAGVTTGGSASGSATTSKSGNVFLQLVTLGFFGQGSSSTTSGSHTDSGWSVQRTWLETRDDINRYAIGIRDIQAWGYTFAGSSELVSKKFTSPKEILKVQLRTDEFVPQALDPERRWIRYYVSVDDGRTWLDMNPLDRPTLFDDNGEIVPYTYTFNLEAEGPQAEVVRAIRTAEPARTLRFRAVLESDSEVLTPVLKSYRVLITPKGSLNDAGF